MDRVDRNREAQPLAAGDDRGVDADDSAGARDERSAGIAGIERRVGLDDMLDQASRPGAERPAERADHAARHGVLEAIRVPDRNRQLTWFERLRIAELDRGEIGRGDTDHGDVGVAVLADEIGGALTAVGERDVDRGRAVNDVAVREDEPVAREDKPGAAARLARPWRCRAR